jgi:hypothetical protein
MADFERTTAVGVGADAAFEFFADPANLPAYLATATLTETDVVDGEEEAETLAKAPAPGPDTRFLADRKTLRVEWASGPDYAGSIAVKQSTPSMSDITIRLHTRDDVDPDEVRKVIEQAVRNIGRLLR